MKILLSHIKDYAIIPLIFAGFQEECFLISVLVSNAYGQVINQWFIRDTISCKYFVKLGKIRKIMTCF